MDLSSSLKNVLIVTPTGGSGVPVGTLSWILTYNTPSGYLKVNGAAISRVAYSDLMNNTFLTIPTTCSTTISSAILTGIPTTLYMGVGMNIEGIGIPVGATITSINSLTSITISSVSTVSSTLASVIIFPFGNGDGSTTINLPDFRGEHLRAFDDMRNADTTAFTCVITSSSAAITNLPSTRIMFIGMPISGTGIPVGSTIASITSSTAITISAVATASGTLATFTGRRFGSWESDDFKTHIHYSNMGYSNSLSAGAGYNLETTPTIGYLNINTSSTGGAETRGRNYAIPVYIKY